MGLEKYTSCDLQSLAEQKLENVKSDSGLIQHIRLVMTKYEVWSMEYS